MLFEIVPSAKVEMQKKARKRLQTSINFFVDLDVGPARPGPARLGPARLGSARFGSNQFCGSPTGPPYFWAILVS